MNDSLSPDDDERPEESLGKLPPNPMPESEGIGLGCSLVLYGLAGAGALFLIGTLMTPAMGATRSSKLEWERRQQEIEKAQQDAQNELDENR